MCFLRSSCILIIVSAILQPYGTVAANEPACSIFDYKEKLLEKVIRMEIKVEQIVEDMKKAQDNTMSLTTDMARRVENIENSTVKLREDIERVVLDIQEENPKPTKIAETALVPIVAFNVRLSTSVTVSRNDIVVFDTVLLNEGEGFARATGMFTAPYNGLYYFAGHLCNRGNKSVQYAIVVENNQITSSTQYDNDDIYSCSSVTAVAIMKSAERAWIISLISSSHIYYDSYRWNSFVGALLNK